MLKAHFTQTLFCTLRHLQHACCLQTHTNMLQPVTLHLFALLLCLPSCPISAHAAVGIVVGLESKGQNEPQMRDAMKGPQHLQAPVTSRSPLNKTHIHTSDLSVLRKQKNSLFTCEV
ncbi:hypothetical protein CRENBAI_022270 [Crenichthys baileyi]|uniref:Uncharacterized protein n=1 Tax=Crenichthys baileyi TaxID=28760 RepID=A0AAV9SGR3_9TELE